MLSVDYVISEFSVNYDIGELSVDNGIVELSEDYGFGQELMLTQQDGGARETPVVIYPLQHAATGASPCR